MYRFVVLALFGGGLMASVLPAQAPAESVGQARAADPERGRLLYDDYGCYQCHGYAAQGGTGSRLAPRPLAFAAFVRYTRQPVGEMPPYTARVLSDQQLADIYSFLQSIPEPPPVESIPILRDN